MRVVPLYVTFGSESFKDQVEIDSQDFYQRLQDAPTLPTTSQPTPQDFVEAFEQLAGYERIYALQLSSKLSGTFQSSVLAAAQLGGDRIHVVDTETASLAVGLLALAIQRRLAHGTTDDELDGADRSVQARQRRGLHGRHARVSPERRPHRPRSGARRDALERQADPVGRRWRDPPDRQGAGPPEGARGVRSRVYHVRPRMVLGCGSRSHTPTPPSGSRC